MIAEIEKGRKVTPPRLHRVNPGSCKTSFFFFNLLANMAMYHAKAPRRPSDVGPGLWSPVSWQVIPVEIRTGGSGHRWVLVTCQCFMLLEKKESKSSK